MCVCVCIYMCVCMCVCVYIYIYVHSLMSLEIYTLMKTIDTDWERETSIPSRVPLCPFVCVRVCARACGMDI